MANLNKKGVIIARAVIYVTAMLLIVFVGVFLTLQTRPARDALTGIIESAIAQNIRAVCHIEELSGNLFSRFEIKGVELKDTETGVPLMSASRIQVSYSIPMLLVRVLWINRLIIDDVSVNLLQANDGSWNFEMLSPEKPSVPLPDKPSGFIAFPDFKIEIRRLLIQNSDVTVIQATDRNETIRHLKGIECQAIVDIGKDVSAKVRRLAVSLDNPHIDLTNLSGDIRYNFKARRLNFKDTRIQGRKSDFTVNGLLDFPQNGPNVVKPDMVNMDLKAEIEALSLGEFGQVFPIQMPDADLVSGKLAVKGSVSEMDCQVDLAMDSCHVVSQGLVAIDDLNTVSLDISGKIRGLDLSVLPVLDLKSFPGSLNTDFTLFWQKIGMPDQTGQIILDFTSSKMWDYSIEEAKLGVIIDRADFVFEKMRMKTPFGTFAGSGSLAGILSSEMDNQLQFTADIGAFNPGNLINNNRYTGQINGTIVSTFFIPKTFDRQCIMADATCRINPSQLMAVDILSGDFEAKMRDEKIILTKFDMETALGTAAVTGTASIKDGPCRFKAAAVLPDIKLIKSLIPETESESLAGSVDVTANIGGNWRRPDVTTVINAEKIIYKDMSADFLAAEGDWNGDFQDFRISVTSSLKNVRINGLLFSLLDLNTTINPKIISADIDIQGGQNEHFTFSGNINHWMEPVKEVNIEKMTLVSFEQPPLVNRELVKLSISRDRIFVDSLHLDSGNASLVLKGEAGLIPSADVSAVLALKGFDLKRISGFWEGGEKFQGLMSSDIALTGILKNPVINMTTSIKDVANEGLPMTDVSVSLKYSDSKAQVEASAYRQNEKLLDVHGTVLMGLSVYPFECLPKQGGLDFRMDLEQMDISWISDIINDPEYDISGVLDATAFVSGDFFNPHIQGRMQLSEGELILKKQGLIYETLTADLQFVKNTIIIDALNLKGDKEGFLNLSGVLTYENFKPQTFNIRAVGDQLYIPFHSGVDARINPDITLSGAWEAPVLSGKIEVDEGRVNLERFLEKKFSEIEIVAPVSAKNGVLQIPEKEPEPLAFVDPLTADVAVMIPNGFWFRGKDEFVEIKGDIQLKKDPQKPFVVYGSVFPVRGTYRFRGRLFQIEQGELTFTGQEEINPALDIEAVAVIDDVKIIIRLSGTFEHLNLVLDSEPAMAQAEIISYLVFGRGADDLSEKESFQASAAALSFAGQIAADKLRDIVGDTLGIDYLNISAGSGELRHGSMTMGKYVLPRVFVTFRQGFDETVTQKVEVTYEINKYFDLETQIDNEQTSALDLIWKYDF